MTNYIRKFLYLITQLLDFIRSHYIKSKYDRLTGAYSIHWYHRNRIRFRNFNTLILLDIRHLRSIGDVYDFMTTDQILISTYSIIKNIIPDYYPIIRIGADEFIILIKDHKNIIKDLKELIDSDRFTVRLNNQKKLNYAINAVYSTDYPIKKLKDLESLENFLYMNLQSPYAIGQIPLDFSGKNKSYLIEYKGAE